MKVMHLGGEWWERMIVVRMDVVWKNIEELDGSGGSGEYDDGT